MFVKTPRLIKRIFSEYIWSFDTNHKEIYLTFDDGPTPEITEWVLAQLKEYNAKATFFCIGDNIKKHPHIFQQIRTSGHQIGNHTYNHLKGWRTPTKNYIENTELCALEIRKHAQQSLLFRPPYGKIKNKQAKLLLQKNYKIVMWDVLSKDYDTKLSTKECTQNVIQNIRPGSIVVFHDSIKAFPRLKESLIEVLQYLKENNYECKSIN